MNVTSIAAEWFVDNETFTGTSSTLPPVVPCTAQASSCANFQFVLNTVVIGTLCLLGLTGNTLSILVLQKDQHNRVAVFLLQTLAVADNSVLLLTFFVLSIIYGLQSVMGESFLQSLVPILKRYVNPLGYTAQCCVIWITVLLAVNRYMAVCRPFTAKRWVTVTSVRLQVLFVVIISFVLNVPRFFYYNSRSKCLSTAPTTYCHNASDTASFAETTNSVLQTTTTQQQQNTTQSCPVDLSIVYFERIYLNVFYTSIVLILPLVLMFGFNVPLIMQIQESKRRMIENSLSYRGLQENNITVVMVVVVLVMIICHAPDRVVQIMRVTHAVENINCPNAFFYATNFANLLVMINSSTDFIIYYVFRRRFRTILRDKLRCCCIVSAVRGRDRNVDYDAPSGPQRISEARELRKRTEPIEMKPVAPYFSDANTDTNPMVHFIETDHNQIDDVVVNNHR